MDCLVYSLKYYPGNIILDSSLFSLQTFYSVFIKKKKSNGQINISAFMFLMYLQS